MCRFLQARMIFLSLAVMFAGGCASPAVVQERQTGDTELNCNQLVRALDEARDFERRARGERGATGTNVAAAIFFWPGLIATYANTEDAIEAAKERQRYLGEIYEDKGCDQSIMADSKAEPATVTEAVPTIAGSYTVSAISGAPAFGEPDGQGTVLHRFSNGEVLTVIEATSDGKWYKVLLPDGEAGYVPSIIIRAPTSAK